MDAGGSGRYGDIGAIVDQDGDAERMNQLADQLRELARRRLLEPELH
jgi:hypothetical protein